MGDVPTLVEDQPDEVVDEAEEIEATVADAADVVDDANEKTEAAASGDVNEQTAEISDDDLGGGLFAGVEGEDDDSGSSSSAESEEDGDGDEDPLDVADGLDGNSAAMESAINEGAARLAVMGLTDADFEDSDQTKEDLETEFSETFEAFRLGFFGSQVVDEYVLTPADGDVSPAWGLAGAILVAAALVIWQRPDGDEAVEKARSAAGNLAGSVGVAA